MRWFAKKAGVQKEKLSSLEVAKRLDDLFTKRGAPEVLKQLKEGFGLPATETELYICVAALYLVSFMRAFTTEELQIKSSVANEIFHELTTSLVVRPAPPVQSAGSPGALFKQLKEATESFLYIWDQNIRKAPNPQWYVGREACALLMGRDRMPHPGLVLRVSTMLSDDTAAIRTLLKELQEKYLLVG